MFQILRQFPLRQMASIIFILSLAIGSPCQAESNKTNSIMLAVEDSWPPYADANGQGIATDIVQQAFSAVGIKLFLKVLPYARVLDKVEKGIIVGGYNVTRQASTEEKFLFGQQVLLTVPASFYFHPDNNQALKYRDITDIPDGSRVGLIIDYEYGNGFEQHKHRFKQIRVSTQTQIINMLRFGRIDSAIMFDEVASDALKTMSLDESSIIKGPLNNTSDIYVAFSRRHKNAQFFADKLDQGLLLIREAGQYQKPIPH
jgi:polar amino acid transport system substrate-binding protein